MGLNRRVVESPSSFRCVEFSDRLDLLVAAIARGEAVERSDDLTFRFVALDAAVPPEWIDQD